MGAGASGNRDDLRLDAGTCEGFLVQGRSRVVTKDAYVAGGHAPALTSDHGGRNLASRQERRGAVFHFGTAFRIVCQGNERVCRIQADADKVNLGRFCHPASVPRKAWLKSVQDTGPVPAVLRN